MKEEQEKLILDALSGGAKTVEELSAMLYASPSTIRRALGRLEEKKLITRTHGGAVLNDESTFRPSFSFRTHENALSKKRIAITATKLINNGDLIFLDGTTTSFFIAAYHETFSNIKVMTNGIDTLSLLAKIGITAYSTGGRINEENRSVLIGAQALRSVSDMYADIAFFSARTVTASGDIYDCFEDENTVRKSMIAHAKKRVFLCDSAKLGKTDKYKLCNISDVDIMVCEKDIRSYFTTDKLPQILQ